VSPLDSQLSEALQALADAKRYRRRRLVEARAGGTKSVRVDGQDCLAFCSNDYLGLAQHPRVLSAFVDGVREWGAGSGASHLVSGHCREHHALEEEIADFVQRPRALLFSGGYMANLAVVTALLSTGDRVFEDRLNHASLLDGGWLSRSRFERYPHADVDELRRGLATPCAGRSLVISDGVFSMDGDVAPLGALAATCQELGASLFVDDAHGFGVLGAHGRGSLESENLGVDQVPILMCTLGKAVGTFGAFVAGSEPLIEYLIQRGRTYIYTTALPPAVATATRAALRTLQEEAWRREHLGRLVERFRPAARSIGLKLLPSATPIQPVVLGHETSALAASDALFDAGIWVPAIRPPTVPEKSSRLRITFSATHTDSDLDRLLEALSRLQRQGLFN
jgi:8-amino-7-oxononanoate synthase